MLAIVIFVWLVVVCVSLRQLDDSSFRLLASLELSGFQI